MKRYITVVSVVCMLAFCFGCGQTDGALPESESVQDNNDAQADTFEAAADGMQGPDVSETAGEVQEQGADESETTGDGMQESETDTAEEDMLEVPAGGRRLTTEELQEYTAWIQDSSNYGFLLSDWDNPAQINLYEVFYCGAGIGRPGTEEEKQAYLERHEQPEIYTDFLARDRSAVNDFLLDKTGLSYEELLAKGSEGMESDYFAETDSFCTEAGDTNYCQFICTDGVVNKEGTVVTLLCDGDDWVRTCEVKVSVAKDHRSFLSNHILEGRILDTEETSGEDTSGGQGSCLIDGYYFDNLHTDADASAVENAYVLGDWSRITKESMQGVWYHHPRDVGESTEYDVVLQLDEQAAVYYPAVGFYGDALYEWDIVDRSDRGLCPEHAIYFRGTKEGELAWYVLGISEERDYFWCNGEVFYRQ